MTAISASRRSHGWTMIKMMMRMGASVHTLSNAGWTPLHFAVAANSLDVAEYLIT